MQNTSKMLIRRDGRPETGAASSVECLLKCAPTRYVVMIMSTSSALLKHSLRAHCS